MPLGTISPMSDFDAGAVAEQLREALAGFGTDEDVVISCLCKMNNEQRQEVAQAFKTSYGKDLIDDLKSELRGDFEEVVVAAMTPPRLYDAKQLHDAVAGAGTDETQIVEILCTRSNEEIEDIKRVYKEEFESELEEDLASDTSGYFKRMLVSILAGGREPEDELDMDKAQEDAQKFLDAGENRWGTDESEINRILCLRSYTQLRATMAVFEEQTGGTMEDSIRSECSGSLQAGYLAIVEAAKFTPQFFARRLNDCMAGLGTSDSDLIRIIVSRSEVDLAAIKEAYERLYEKPLRDAVSDECGGDYKKMLLCLIDQPE